MPLPSERNGSCWFTRRLCCPFRSPPALQTIARTGRQVVQTLRRVEHRQLPIDSRPDAAGHPPRGLAVSLFPEVRGRDVRERLDHGITIYGYRVSVISPKNKLCPRGTFSGCLPSYLLKANSSTTGYDQTSQSIAPPLVSPLTPVAFEILLALADGERHGYDAMTSKSTTHGRPSISPNPGKRCTRALDRLVQGGLLTVAVRSAEGESRRVFSLSPLGKSVAAAEAARLSDEVLAARSLRLFKGSGA